ncbi:MAG: adenosylcobinamide-GDP ribazoletransferase [Caldilineaceae bacterium]|nr:adenosylcobinamide-GDP ribazoletransferase [Caldilineaceae bacterium]
MAHEEQTTQPHWWDELAVAVGFLTTLPTPTVPFRPGLLGQAGRWFPLVGALLGLLLSGGYWGLSWLFPPTIVAVLITILWTGLTGGLHLDGLADCCDGLLAAVPPARRLEIMRDPRTGAFAVIGVVLVLLLRAACIGALPSFFPALLLIPTWARWLLLWIARYPATQNNGLGAEFHSTLTTQTLQVALILPLVFAVLFFQWQLCFAIVGAIGTTWGIMRIARQRLGGNTGDVLGLSIELSEVVMLLLLCVNVTASSS